MAKVNGNVAMSNLQGAIGRELVIKRDKFGNTIVAAHPRINPNRVPSAAQLAHQLAFRSAVNYGHAMKADPVYLNKALGTPHSPFNLAVADWFKPPQVVNIDLGGYTGLAGQVIHVKAQANVLVTAVTIVITNADGSTLEQGPATSTDSLSWAYTTKSAAVGAHPKVQATAWDLPGHSAKLEQVK